MSVVMWPMTRPGNDASYVTEHNFRDFVAFGLGTCWLSGDPDNVNENCFFSRPFEPDDVTQLREGFLDALESIVYHLWTGTLKPGHGDVESDHNNTLIVGTNDHDETYMEWYVRLDDDAIMMELTISGADSETIWLGYGALLDKQNVVKVLTEARQFVWDKKVWDKLVEEANK